MRSKSHKITHLNRDTLNRLAKEPDSFVELIKSPYEIIMEPYDLGDEKESIKRILQQDVGKYSQLFKGILLGCQNMTLLTPQPNIYGICPTLHICVQAEFFVFKPVIGAVLKGVVNVSERGGDHIGCLVHQTFNVTIPKPEDDDEWMGSGVKPGAEVAFEITQTSFSGRLPYIRGVLKEILFEPDSGVGTASDEADHRMQNRSPKKKRKSQQQHDESCAVPQSQSPKKSVHVSFAEPLEEAAATATLASSPSKKKRKHTETPEDEVEDFQTPKRRKVKTEKLSDESDYTAAAAAADEWFAKPKKLKKVKPEKLSEDSDTGSLTDLDLGGLLKSGRVDFRRATLGSFTDLASKGKARRKSFSLEDNIKIERDGQFELPEDSELEAIIKTEDGRKKKKVKKRDSI